MSPDAEAEPVTLHFPLTLPEYTFAMLRLSNPPSSSGGIAPVDRAGHSSIRAVSPIILHGGAWTP